MIIGVTGSRDGISKDALQQFNKFIDNHNISECHHGDCVGADKIIHDIVTKNKIKTVIHPPTYSANRAFCKGNIIKDKKDYLQRNKDIVNESDIIIAFPKTMYEVMRSGTWHTIRYTKKQSKALYIIYPNGKLAKANVRHK